MNITKKQWLEKAFKLFGRDVRNWQFECPNCGNTQSYKDFEKLGMRSDDIQGVLFYSCIGRWDKSQGCDYTNDGLICIAPITVTVDEFRIPVFNFATKVKKIKHTKFIRGELANE